MTPEECKAMRKRHANRHWSNTASEDVNTCLDALDEAEAVNVELRKVGQLALQVASEQRKRIGELEAAFKKADSLLEEFRAAISRDDLSDEAYECWCEASKFVCTQGGTRR